MKLVIDIPEEFEEHFNTDRFEDSLCRLSADAHLLAGNYEQEVGIMLIKSFRNSKPLPKGHGDLVDRDKVIDLLQEQQFHYYPDLDMVTDTVYEVEAIIESDESRGDGNETCD